MFGSVKSALSLFFFKRKWRAKNRNNSTIANSVFDLSSVSVGNHTYGNIKILNFGKQEKLTIGHCCSIGPEVVFILNADHNYNYVSTFPFKVKMGIDGCDKEGISKGDIVVEDDVWIGMRCTILSGVHIGRGAVIAAGSVITKDVPPYAIVGGVPAKVIKYRFSEKVIEKLMTVDFSKISRETVQKNLDAFYSPISEENAEEIISKIVSES